MSQFDGELAALQHQRKMEAISVSPTAAVLGSLADIADKFGMPGAGLFAQALKSGQTPVEKIVEQIEIGAYSQIVRIEKRQNDHEAQCDQQFNDFQERLQSVEAQNAYFSAILHGLRTSDPKKQLRLGALTINCIYTNDTQPESLDDMMRAAVELKEVDIKFLERIYESQIRTLRSSELTDAKRMEEMTKNWPNELTAPTGRERVISGYRMSVARLQAHAFVQFRTPGLDIGGELVFLLEDGAKFFEMMRDIAQP